MYFKTLIIVAHLVAHLAVGTPTTEDDLTARSLRHGHVPDVDTSYERFQDDVYPKRHRHVPDADTSYERFQDDVSRSM
ncbi:hypothetical protein B0T24DRAFT_683693 [Lasiosphaeria ovina]|uniref:Uncharacterized protein n=1 Tax=Lasiosphaeria ovina TaxID=92902 RepID=A0AAE0JVG4_9PEZI|nr:hypothetical protein B0T24DRAFT_683693 [Lasiosphaeria ovina]